MEFITSRYWHVTYHHRSKLCFCLSMLKNDPFHIGLHQWIRLCVCNLICCMCFQAADEPAYLTVGTDVSAKYRGAFCEAKIKTVKRLVKVKVRAQRKKVDNRSLTSQSESLLQVLSCTLKWSDKWWFHKLTLWFHRQVPSWLSHLVLHSILNSNIITFCLHVITKT